MATVTGTAGGPGGVTVLTPQRSGLGHGPGHGSSDSPHRPGPGWFTAPAFRVAGPGHLGSLCAPRKSGLHRGAGSGPLSRRVWALHAAGPTGRMVSTAPALCPAPRGCSVAARDRAAPRDLEFAFHCAQQRGEAACGGWPAGAPPAAALPALSGEGRGAARLGESPMPLSHLERQADRLARWRQKSTAPHENHEAYSSGETPASAPASAKGGPDGSAICRSVRQTGIGCNDAQAGEKGDAHTHSHFRARCVKA